MLQRPSAFGQHGISEPISQFGHINRMVHLLEFVARRECELADQRLPCEVIAQADARLLKVCTR
jgi:hypothetical protein